MDTADLLELLSLYLTIQMCRQWYTIFPLGFTPSKQARPKAVAMRVPFPTVRKLRYFHYLLGFILFNSLNAQFDEALSTFTQLFWAMKTPSIGGL